MLALALQVDSEVVNGMEVLRDKLLYTVSSDCHIFHGIPALINGEHVCCLNTAAMM